MSTHIDNVLAVHFIHFSIFSMKMVHTILNKSYLLLQKLKLMQGKRIKYFLFDNVLSIYNFFYMFWKFNRKKLGN